MIRLWVAVVFLVWAVPVSHVAADPDRAKHLFAEGNERLDAGDFVAAEALFRQSLAEFPHPPTANNLATALVRGENYVEALTVLEGLRDGKYGALPADRLDAVSRRITEVRALVGTIRVSLRGADSATVRLDGKDIGHLEAASLDIVVNPGLHVISASADGFPDVMVHASALAANVLPVVLEFALAEPSPPPVATPPPSHPPKPPEDDRAEGGLFSEPLFWVSAAVILAGAGVLTGVLLLNSDTAASPQAEKDPFFGVTATGLRAH